MKAQARQKTMIVKAFAPAVTGGYEAATCIDDLINTLLREHPISSAPGKWIEFARTIRTSCDLIEKVAVSEFSRASAKRK